MSKIMSLLVLVLLFVVGCAESPSPGAMSGRDAEIYALVQGEWSGSNKEEMLNYKFVGSRITTWTSASQALLIQNPTAYNKYEGREKDFWVEDGVIYFREYATPRKLSIRVIDHDTLQRGTITLHRASKGKAKNIAETPPASVSEPTTPPPVSVSGKSLKSDFSKNEL